MKKIGILMGGFSSEREISLKSGTAVCAALAELGYEITVIDFKNTEELIKVLRASDFDCVFNALHGRFGEDGQVQKILDDLAIPYTGSGARASELAMDKIASRQIFENDCLAVPVYKVLNRGMTDMQGFNLEFPLVVKPASEGSSIGLFIVENPEALFLALKQAFKFDQNIIIEKYIKGREITVGILNDTALPIIEIVTKNKFYDFQAKYTKGFTEYIVPADLPADVSSQAQQTALKAHQLLGCRSFSRVDMIVDETGCVVVLEVNTIPGLTATSLLPKAALASGISFTQLCQKMILSAIGENKKKVLSESGY